MPVVMGTAISKSVWVASAGLYLRVWGCLFREPFGEHGGTVARGQPWRIVDEHCRTYMILPQVIEFGHLGMRVGQDVHHQQHDPCPIGH